MRPSRLVLPLVVLLTLPAAAAPAPLPLCMDQEATILGGAGDDHLEGTPGNDVMVGLTGDDTIDGRAGDDIICGGDGDDVISGGGGVDIIDTGTGADVARAGGGRYNVLIDAWPVGGMLTPLPVDISDDTFIGGPGRDWFMPDGGNDSIDGRAGVDLYDSMLNLSPVHINLLLGVGVSARAGIDAISGVEDVIGGMYDDVIVGDDGNNSLMGIWGRDRVYGAGGADLVGSSISGALLDGGTGQSSDAVVQILSEPGRIDLAGGTVSSLEHATDVPDRISNFNNAIGTSHDDELVGDDAPNTLVGREGNDYLEGGEGEDRLFGDGGLGFRAYRPWTGGDFLDGGPGRDHLDGGPRSDRCIGEVRVACERRQVKVERPPDDCGFSCGRRNAPSVRILHMNAIEILWRGSEHRMPGSIADLLSSLRF